MDAELPIWRRCFLGKVFEQWRNQVLGIVVGWISVRVPSRQIEIGVENETNEVENETNDESTYVENETCTYEQCEGPNTDDGF